MDSKNKTYGYILLENIGKEVDVLACPFGRLSMDALCMGLAADVVRTADYFKEALAAWRQCLPLGETFDVNYSLWGDKIWSWLHQVSVCFQAKGVKVNVYAYDEALLSSFKSCLDVEGDNRLERLAGVSSGRVSTILVCAMRELNETLMAISEFLAEPTEKQIARSFSRWKEFYAQEYRDTWEHKYELWKLQYTPRVLRRRVKERMAREKEAFRSLFVDDDEFDQVFDAERDAVDEDGLSRFLFTHSDRFGSSSLRQPMPFICPDLRCVFDFMALWRWLRADLTPETVRRREEAAGQADAQEKAVMAYVEKVCHLAADSWKPRHHDLWRKIYKAFKKEISKAGPHEKFKDFSKKTVCCILGHLKQRGVYEAVDNTAFTRHLEGCNNGLRKYINNGLVELEDSLRVNVRKVLDLELTAAA
jgi:hypothetical protein